MLTDNPVKDYFIWMLGAVVWEHIASETYNLFYVVFALFCTIEMFLSYVRYLKLSAEHQVQFISTKID